MPYLKVLESIFKIKHSQALLKIKLSDGSDKFNNKLILIDEEKKYELKYSFINELLFIEMEMENGFIKLGFKRS